MYEVKCVIPRAHSRASTRRQHGARRAATLANLVLNPAVMRENGTPICSGVVARGRPHSVRAAPRRGCAAPVRAHGGLHGHDRTCSRGIVIGMRVGTSAIIGDIASRGHAERLARAPTRVNRARSPSAERQLDLPADDNYIAPF